ncbi:MAG: asparaginase [Bryobacteraceae bacterium]|nr:asparaginase [Bryobacteraceae bacterium]
MSRTLFVFTGGTISMSIDPTLGGAVPTLSGEEILSHAPRISTMTEPELIDFSRLPGPHVTPDQMWRLSELLEQHLTRPEIGGAVLTHGTDTLEETAYFLDLRHATEKPVAVVGALRNSSELGWDGPANLEAAARTVLDETARGQGVFVVLNDTVHAASEATKTDTQALDTFQSPVFGPLAVIEKDRVLWRRRLTRRRVVRGGGFEPRVDLFTMYSGFDPRLIDYAVESGARGLVIEGTGRGNVPPFVLPAIEKAVAAGVAVVIATRCWHGRVLDTYSYRGAGRDLRRAGCVFAGSLPGPKARVLLMLALGAGEVRGVFEEGEY